MRSILGKRHPAVASLARASRAVHGVEMPDLRQTAVVLLAMLVGAGAPASSDTLEKLRATGEIRLGVRADAPPFSYIGENGTPLGLAVALCRAVVRGIELRYGFEALETVFVEVTAADRFDALVEGRTDLHCGPASATLSRREIVDFSILYFVDGATVAVPRNGATSLFVLGDDSRIGVLAGTTAEDHVADLLRRNAIRAEMRTFERHVEGLTALADGELDAYVGDSAIVQFQIRRLALDRKVEVLDERLSTESYALMLRRGDDDFRLAVDRALSLAYSSGLINRLLVAELGDYPLDALVRALYPIVQLPE